VVRHALVQKIIAAYEKFEKGPAPEKKNAPAKPAAPRRKK